jgi:hypothetical protein
LCRVKKLCFLCFFAALREIRACLNSKYGDICTLFAKMARRACST